MNTLTLLRGHQRDAEYDAAVWIDNHDRLRRIAGFLAHHPLIQLALLILASPAIAAVAVAWGLRAAVHVVARAHEVAGEGTAPCKPCMAAEADHLAATDVLTYEDVCHGWDLGDALGGTR